MVKCITGKKIYVSLQLAEDALIAARTRFYYSKGQGPVAVYRCDDCGYFHLTSKGPMNSTLAKQIQDGKIDKQQEANAWLKKLGLKE